MYSSKLRKVHQKFVKIILRNVNETVEHDSTKFHQDFFENDEFHMKSALKKISQILHLDQIPEMVNIVDGFQFRNNPPPRPSVLTASFKVVAAARTSTSGI